MKPKLNWTTSTPNENYTQDPPQVCICVDANGLGHRLIKRGVAGPSAQVKHDLVVEVGEVLQPDKCEIAQIFLAVAGTEDKHEMSRMSLAQTQTTHSAISDATNVPSH